jgi:methylated-DNA-[protein]-cysteine S-methyltransferase
MTRHTTTTGVSYRLIDTPIGRLRLAATPDALIALAFENQHEEDPANLAQTDPEASAILQEAENQLLAYFSGKRRAFDLPLQAQGTEFQRTVWSALRDIPYGEVRSYGQIASALGREKAVRAVGAANGRNPIPIIVPCHRVIGSNGKLTGFAGGLEAKRHLLALEGVPGIATATA